LLELFGEPVTIKSPDPEDLVGLVARDELRSSDGKLIVAAYRAIDEGQARRIVETKPKEFRGLRVSRYVTATMEVDPAHLELEALADIYKKVRPGDAPTEEGARSLLHSMFFDAKRYDLDRVGRYKLNTKLSVGLPLEERGLTKRDVIAIVRYLVGLGEGVDGFEVDDIDHLENKRIRGVGELLLNQFRIGFLRMERVARERMTSMDPEKLSAQAIISIKPITAAVRSFFGSGQLSQFMDEVNPLSELTHKRRLSALGPGGLSRQSAKLEVRDVHHSHYGRICPIETPEGPNIGLVGAMAIYARLDEFGFIQTPYRKVKHGKVTDDVTYLSADQEKRYRIAPADTPFGKDGKLVDDSVVCRYGRGYPRVEARNVDCMDVSPAQLFSAATSLIPFLENDDPIRGLMGSNMQRQAVPLLWATPPLVHTGMETRVARDSGSTILADNEGKVEFVDGKRIVLRRRTGELDEYNLQKFVRTNQATCVNHRPVVRPGQRVRRGQVLADGSCTARGELGLGRDLTVIYMPWRGYNFEDAIVLSSRLVRDDLMTSIHIEKYETEAVDTKLGPEEITPDIPNVGDDARKHLDENGIVTPGAEVRAEDILVGKVAPKGQSELTAEEKLVIAIFGKKAEEMRDVSLRMPHGEKGKVTGVRVFSRFRYSCSECGSVYHCGRPPENLTCGVCGGYLDRELGDELPAGVNQLVRVYVAQRRKVMVGDKLAGRHGNKGVIAKILPEEDMPFVADGKPVDVILNPLGVPSRMNVGQILEAHMGLVAEELGVRFRCPVFQGLGKDEVWTYLAAVANGMAARATKAFVEQELVRVVDGEKRSACLEVPPVISGEELRAILRAGGGPPGLKAATEKCLAEIRASLTSQLEAISAEDLGLIIDILALDPMETSGRAKAKTIPTVVEGLVAAGARRAGVEHDTGRGRVRDGYTGEALHQSVMIGCAYLLKLNHLVEDKIHARSTGPYSLVTQQPLGGKAQFGGQRFGEMEVWALEAYGAAHTLQEMLTIKSDDVNGRVRTYESIVKGDNIAEPGVPESFFILVKELESLGLRITAQTPDGRECEIKDVDEEVASPSR
jgi:DNA-directed RNA polymerase subunit beta